MILSKLSVQIHCISRFRLFGFWAQQYDLMCANVHSISLGYLSSSHCRSNHKQRGRMVAELRSMSAFLARIRCAMLLLMSRYRARKSMQLTKDPQPLRVSSKRLTAGVKCHDPIDHHDSSRDLFSWSYLDDSALMKLSARDGVSPHTKMPKWSAQPRLLQRKNFKAEKILM